VQVCGGPIQFVGYKGISCQTDAGRDVFLSSVHRACGPGVAYNEPLQYTIWEIQEADQAPEFSYPDPTGGHFIFETNIHYALNVETSAPPRAAYVVTAAERSALDVALGTATRGMYRKVDDAGTACRSYYFLLQDTDGMI